MIGSHLMDYSFSHRKLYIVLVSTHASRTIHNLQASRTSIVVTSSTRERTLTNNRILSPKEEGSRVLTVRYSRDANCHPETGPGGPKGVDGTFSRALIIHRHGDKVLANGFIERGPVSSLKVSSN